MSSSAAVAVAPADDIALDVAVAVHDVKKDLIRDVILAAAVVLALVVAVAVSTRVEVAPRVRDAALFVHLASLVLGFGTVLAIDWFGMRWILGKTEMPEMLAITAALTPPIWLGLAGLVASGVVLGPDVSSPLTLLKLLLVTIVAINGVHARALHRAFARLPDAPQRRRHRRRWLSASRRLMIRGMMSGGISQLCWWSATVIGFLNAQP